MGASGDFIALNGDAGGQARCVLPDFQAIADRYESEVGFLSATANADYGAAGKRNGDEG